MDYSPSSRTATTFTEVGFLSDIFKVPSTSSTITSVIKPDPSLVSQIGGLATGIYGLSQSDVNPFSFRV